MAGRQAEKFGAELILLGGVAGSRLDPGGPTAIELDGDAELAASVTLAAPGMEWRRLSVDGVEELLGRGVYYGAGRSEAARCSDDEVVVVGAGNSAGQAVLNLAHHGARVTMLVRGDRLGKTTSAYLVERIERCDLIDVRPQRLDQARCRGRRGGRDRGRARAPSPRGAGLQILTRSKGWSRLTGLIVRDIE